MSSHQVVLQYVGLRRLSISSHQVVLQYVNYKEVIYKFSSHRFTVCKL